MLSFRKDIVKNATKWKYVYFDSLLQHQFMFRHNNLFRLPPKTAFHFCVIWYLILLQLLRQAHVRKFYVIKFVDQDIMRFYVSVNYSILMQKIQTLQRLLHYLHYEIKIIQVNSIIPINDPQRHFMPIRLSIFHQIDQIWEVSLALLNRKVHKVFIVLSIKVCNEVRVKINTLQELDLLICNVVMLE